MPSTSSCRTPRPRPHGHPQPVCGFGLWGQRCTYWHMAARFEGVLLCDFIHSNFVGMDVSDASAEAYPAQGAIVSDPVSRRQRGFYLKDLVSVLRPGFSKQYQTKDTLSPTVGECTKARKIELILTPGAACHSAPIAPTAPIASVAAACLAALAAMTVIAAPFARPGL